MKSVRRYCSSEKDTWNAFVASAKNGVFLFDRKYMDYHADRYVDHSAMIFEDDKLVAVFVASENGKSIHSHEGLTYGGLLLSSGARLENVLGYFYHLVKYYDDLGFTDILYKCLPSFLARYSSEEDLYALFLLKSSLVRRDTGCLFVRNQSLGYRHGKKGTITKAKIQNYVICEAGDPTKFWNKVLIPSLSEKYGATPVHTAAEMKLLMDKFPDNIHLYEVVVGHEVLGGTVVFETSTVIHTQYIAATQDGKQNGVLDLLVDNLISERYRDKPFFSFGASMQNGGSQLNRRLMSWKEGFGARTVALDHYLIKASHYHELAAYA